ncbi:MAG: nickel pincer cofactor biosynthesis protein LarB [Nitrospira sp.]|nr:nickel pincer cofactor biosynthesis protein LarB [Nitrospira sp.]
MKRKSTPAATVHSRKPDERLDGVSQGMLRSARQGFPPVVFCDGKSHQEIVSLARKLLAQHEHLIVPRVTPEIAQALLRLNRRAVYHELSRAVTVSHPTRRRNGDVVIVTAGTADTPVAEEAGVTAEVLGSRVETICDVGVAGLHRVLARHSRLMQAHVVVVVAGMDGALPSVIGGLVNCPVIAVPTSIGYGANFGGVAPLLTMLNSCASGVGVVNINSGFSAGCLAHRINILANQ